MLNRRPALHQRGFTLSEILVTTAIFAIIMIAALAVYDQSNKVFKTSTEAADLQQSTRIGYDKLVADVRMAGFDYNRGGLPTNSWEAPQPDEQLEYAGTSVIAFRSNFNYNTQAANGNGLESTYTPLNTDGNKIFPYVTTSNDEIVIYALRSTDSTKNTNSVSFYVDDYVPRAAFPSTITPGPKPANPSHPEEIVKLSSTTCAGCGIDISNANPPYTLYRITVSDIKAGRMGTPVAENIRSMNFRYYTDTTAQTPLKDPAGAAITTGYNADGSTFTAAPATCTTAATADCTGAIGGHGQYNPDSVGTTTHFSDRDMRAQVAAIRVDLVGMNATPDIQGYNNPAETLTAYQNYREYALSSVIVPRNLGKTGFPEPVYAAPGPPSITGMCTGYCGAPTIFWSAPTAGGPVEKYEIVWDTTITGSFAAPHNMTIADPMATSAIIPDHGTEDVSIPWIYKMRAVNATGASVWSSPYSVTPKSNTKPAAPSSFKATDDATSDAQPNKITLSWTSPALNDTSLNTLSCTGTGGSTDGSAIPSQELIGYRIYRGTTSTFDAAHASIVLDYTSGSQPALTAPGSAMTWVDNSVNDVVAGPANCIHYYYRIEAANRCRSSNSYNVGSAADAVSAVTPAWGSPGKEGYANGTGTPAAPITLVIDTTNSGCPDPTSPSSPNCKIILQWPRVTTDTSTPANSIGVDTYRIYRSVKHQNNIPSATYSADTSFGGGAGYIDVPGYSSLSGGTLTYTDNPLVNDPDPSGTYLGYAYAYEYTVAAKGCSTFSVKSPAVDYPTSCSGVPTITNTGGGGGTGNTPAAGDSWVLNNGDTIVVTPPVGLTYTAVTFTVAKYPSGTSSTIAGTYSAPSWAMTWGDLISGATYTVIIRVVDSTGCSSTYIKYVQQQTIAPCAFPNIPAASLPVAAHGHGTSKNTETYDLPLPNNGTDDLFFTTTTASYSGATAFTGVDRIWWNDPRTVPVGSTYNTSLSAVVHIINPGATTVTNNVTTTPTVKTSLVSPPDVASGINILATVPKIPAGSTTSVLRIQFTHDNHENDYPDTVSPSGIKKICILYRIPSEPITTKFCNIVGQTTPTFNPTRCD